MEKQKLPSGVVEFLLRISDGLPKINALQD
jgi:hypothetical protein